MSEDSSFFNEAVISLIAFVSAVNELAVTEDKNPADLINRFWADAIETGKRMTPQEFEDFAKEAFPRSVEFLP